mmetsp:Transcript_36757/g.90466  ORF Transcript_36757/g.90466 Transcript_36757/m.90466 type:complete len:159 (-) Transcript_36757:343-819(-)
MQQASTTLLLVCLVAGCLRCSAFAPPLLAMRSRQRAARLVAGAAGGGAAGATSLRMISDEMKKKLEKESDAPLRFPLLGIAAVVGGKGLTDAMVTVAKGSMGMVNVADNAPMLAVDALCVFFGIALAMRVSNVWRGCTYNPTTWYLGKAWFLEGGQDK